MIQIEDILTYVILYSSIHFFYIANLWIILESFYTNNNFNYKKCQKMLKDTIILQYSQIEDTFLLSFE